LYIAVLWRLLHCSLLLLLSLDVVVTSCCTNTMLYCTLLWMLLLLLCQTEAWVVVDVGFRVGEHFHQPSVTVGCFPLHGVLRMMMWGTT